MQTGEKRKRDDFSHLLNDGMDEAMTDDMSVLPYLLEDDQDEIIT